MQRILLAGCLTAAADESESVACDEAVVGNSLSEGENPTLNDYSHVVYVFVERQPGWHGCAGFSKDTALYDFERKVITGGHANEWRPKWQPENIYIPLTFLTDEKRRTGSQEYSRLPLVAGETTGYGITDANLLCGPDQLPFAFWDDQNGFYTVSNDDRLEAFNRIANYGEIDAANAVGTGWFFVINSSEQQWSLGRSFCWRVPNWQDVPVKRCPQCQTGMR